MRNQLITTIHCAECGSALDIATSHNKPAKPDTSGLHRPTGAAYLGNEISVKPCRKCKENYSKPALLIRDAVKALDDLN